MKRRPLYDIADEIRALEKEAAKSCRCDGGNNNCAACCAERKLRDLKKGTVKTNARHVLEVHPERFYNSQESQNPRASMGQVMAEVIVRQAGKEHSRTALWVDTINIDTPVKRKQDKPGDAFYSYGHTGDISISLRGELIAAEDKEKAKPTLPVGVSVLLTNKDGQLLLGRRKNNTGAGLLSTPGGRLEVEETIPLCAVRELAEECGVTVSQEQVSIIGFKEHFRFGGHYIMFYVHVRFTGDIICNKEPDKCEGWTWTSLLDIRPAETTEPTDIVARLATILAAW